MNRRPELPDVRVPVDLTREPDFTIGGLGVFPSRRQVCANGAREVVQPRVMQVLLALVRAQGAVVSREDLIESCWDGVVVGDDAINRCVAKVRQISELGAGGNFKIETIPRVGYRLETTQRPTFASPSPGATVAPMSLLAAVADAPGKSPPRRIRYGMVFAGLCVIALLGLAGFRLFAPRTATGWTVSESHQPFIGTSQIESHPALSPDGTMLAYSAGPNYARRQIFLRILKGDSSIQLTHGAYDASSPAWSPDDETIAYTVFESGRPCRIMEMQIPSGQPYEVGKCRTAERTEVTFNPASRTLVFTDVLTSGGPERLVQLDPDSGNVAPLTDPPATVLGDESPSFSPDGRRLAYDRYLTGARAEVRLRQMSDGGEDVVTRYANFDCSAFPNWTPDGAALLISAACQGSDSSLALYPLDGGTPSLIVAGGHSIGRLSVSANGYVAMETGSGHAHLLAFKPGLREPPTVLDEESGVTPWCAGFAPDGTLAITGRKGRALAIWVADSESAPLRKLVSVPQAACAIAWSPDGARLAFIQPGSAGWDVPVVSRGGEILARFHFGEKDSGLLVWSADGRSIPTSRLDPQGFRIWCTDLATGKSVPVSPFGWWDPQVYGTMLFAEKAGAGGIWRLDQGSPQRVAEGITPDANDLFTISGDRLYFADESDPQHPVISSQSVYGGEKKRLIDLPFGLAWFTLAIAPKSGDVVFAARAEDDRDIALIRLSRR